MHRLHHGQFQSYAGRRQENASAQSLVVVGEFGGGGIDARRESYHLSFDLTQAILVAFSGVIPWVEKCEVNRGLDLTEKVALVVRGMKMTFGCCCRSD